MSAPEPFVPATDSTDTGVQDVVTPIRGRHSTALAPVPDPKVGVFGVIGDRRPAIWTTGLPALADNWQYGKTAKYTGENGAVRRLGQAYQVISLGLVAAAYAFIWVVIRPSRVLVAAVLGALFVLTINAL